jgi:enoyl-CoA hydratase
LATHCIAAKHFPQILAKLSAAEPIDPILDDLHEDQRPGPLQADKVMIEEFFSAGSLQEIWRRLENANGASKAFASTTLADLKTFSPLALMLTNRHIRSVRGRDLRETLIQDYRIAVRCLDGHDFAEGVRAALIDKDGAPRWQHSGIEDVTDVELVSYFAPFGQDDLQLPTRTEMQAARS